jgi:hypothetical protein
LDLIMFLEYGLDTGTQPEAVFPYNYRVSSSRSRSTKQVGQV